MVAASPAQDVADFVIVGGGTAGLVVAARLSQNPALKIQVFEAGKNFATDPCTEDLSVWFQNISSERDWQYDTCPQASLDGRKFVQTSGKLLGGSSAINGGYYVPPSRTGIDAWARLGNKMWTYEKFLPYCQRSIQVHVPSQTQCNMMGVDAPDTRLDLKGRPSGPIQLSTVIDEHPIGKAYLQAWKDLGLGVNAGIFQNNSAGGAVVYYTQDPSSKSRSSATTYLETAQAAGHNLFITTEAIVHKIQFRGAPPHVRATGVEVSIGGRRRLYKAKREVILAAGAFNTPKLLELSGIGQNDRLAKHGIAPVIHNAHVGENLQNHVMISTDAELNPNITPSSGMAAVGLLPSQNAPGLVELLEERLPGISNGRPEDITREIFLDSREGSCYHYMLFGKIPNHASFGILQAIPFSRGSTHLSSPNAEDKPNVDPAFLSHPLDLEVMARHLQATASFLRNPVLNQYFKADRDHSQHLEGGLAGLEAAKNHIRQNAATAYHSCGTAAMLPEDSGGVVDETLKVYGAENLRIVDASIIPLIAHGNPIATVYGIAERAAELISASCD